MPKKMRKGSCHCGAVQFEVETAESLKGMRCNCSICAMKGAVMVYVPLDALQITRGCDQLSCYSFNTGIAKHFFCSICGIHCFHQPRSDPSKYAINASTLEDICPYADFPDIAVSDGVHHQKDHGGVARIAGRLRFDPTDPDE